MPYEVNIHRLMSDIESLAEIGKSADGGITRPAFSDAYAVGAAWLRNTMEKAGLKVRIDGAGNIIGRIGGSGAAIALGSHIDTVPGGGQLDGAYGVLAAIECIRRLSEIPEFSLETPVEVIAFSDEEGCFIDLFGSRAMAGHISEAEIKASANGSGVKLVDALQAYGLSCQMVHTAKRNSGDYKCYVELHIEQGIVLERRNIDIGIVTGIAGISRCEYRFIGQKNHAGSTPMEERRDALRAAAKFIDQAYDQITKLFQDTRMTFGVIEIDPNLLNVIPGTATIRQEVRDTSSEICAKVCAETHKIALSVAATLEIGVEIIRLNDDAAVPMSENVIDSLERICSDLSYQWCRIPSWASHDAQIAATKWPSGMLFIPSRAGISHHPTEFSLPKQIERGANVLLNWLATECDDRLFFSSNANQGLRLRTPNTTSALPISHTRKSV